MMMMMKLAEATANVDVYIVASNNTGGGGRGEGRGGEGRGGQGRGRGAETTTGGGSGEPPRPQTPAQRHSNMANLACYPAINIPNGFADTGSPTNVTFFARPFAEMELLALAKAYQDAAGFHLRKPAALDTKTATAAGDRG
jgi:Asp-tRNA(Asn)/Glu-tRNA(Gln) amidotransferase A subunit family amidase